MKTKIFLSSASVLAVVFAVTVIGVGEASAATGDLKNIFPPGNNGTTRGVGMIDGHDGNKYVFRTPEDNGGKELDEGNEVFFEPGNGRTAHSVTQESDSTIGQAGHRDLVDSEIELQEGKKGLNAVNIKTAVSGVVIDIPSAGSKIGDPIPDIDITIELPRTKGTVKFFNEKESVGDGLQTDKGRGIPENSIEMIAKTPNGSTVVNILKGKLP